MLSPKRIKYRKPHKGNLRGMSNSGNYVCYGTYGMKAMEPGWITNRQIEAGRISLSRRVRKIGRLWIRIFPNKSITKKPAETRMGKGKGSVSEWVVSLKRGAVLFEIEGLRDELNSAFVKELHYRLPCSIRLISSNL
jgi:large subunit ribosomal protein L16